MITVKFHNNDGSGFANNVEVETGTTVQEFFKARMGWTADPKNYVIRVTRGETRFTPTAGEALRDKDRVSILPSKIEGA